MGHFKPQNTVVLHNSKKGNNYAVAKHIADHVGCQQVAAEDQPLPPFETVFLVLSNWGDEELPQPMEDFLFDLTPTKKKYLVCEIGNYFGLEDYCGCKKVASQILDGLGWEKISDISLDSVPEVEWDKLKEWLNALSDDD